MVIFLEGSGIAGGADVAPSFQNDRRALQLGGSGGNLDGAHPEIVFRLHLQVHRCTLHGESIAVVSHKIHFRWIIRLQPNQPVDKRDRPTPGRLDCQHFIRTGAANHRPCCPLTGDRLKRRRTDRLDPARLVDARLNLQGYIQL